MQHTHENVFPWVCVSKAWELIIGQPFVKRFTLCYRSVVCLFVSPVCNVGVLWPNGWMDQDETLCAGRSWPWPHCVSWGPTKGAQPYQFSANICCGQMAGWIKMPLGLQVGLSSGDFVLDGDPALPSQKGGEVPKFSAHVYCGKTAGWINMALGMEVGLSSGDFVLDGDPALLPKKGAEPLPNFWPISIVARWLDTSRFHLVWI